MGPLAVALKNMLAAGMDHGDVVRAIAEMEEAFASAPELSARQARNRRYYDAKQRLKASEKRLNSDAQENPAEASESVLKRLKASEIKTPLARVRDINSNSEITGILSPSLAQEWAGVALADLARSSGIASIHDLRAAMNGKNPCSLDDIEAGVRGAAAWSLGRHGPGSMTNWRLAVRMAGEARDRRQAGAPDVVDLAQHRATGPPGGSFSAQLGADQAEARRRVLEGS